MTMYQRSRAFGRAPLADESGRTTAYHALLIGLSASAVLIMVHIGATLAAAH